MNASTATHRLAELGRWALPDSIKDRIRPAYNRLLVASASATGNTTTTVTYNGHHHRIGFLPSTSKYYSGLVAGGQTKERVPLSYLDVPAETDTIIDVGAHVGTYTVLLTLLNDTDVLAFEPDAYSRGIATATLAANGLDAEVRPEVIVGHDGTETLHVAPDDGSESHSAASPRSDAFEQVEIPCRALSSVFAEQNIQQPWVKVDIEGAERAVLKDLRDAPQPVSGLVELHPEKLDGGSGGLLDNLRAAADNVQFVAEASPNHPDDDSIDGDNRPMYHFEGL